RCFMFKAGPLGEVLGLATEEAALAGRHVGDNAAADAELQRDRPLRHLRLVEEAANLLYYCDGKHWVDLVGWRWDSNERVAARRGPLPPGQAGGLALGPGSAEGLASFSVGAARRCATPPGGTGGYMRTLRGVL